MKKPEKIEPNCPLIQIPCVEDGCKFWLTMERRNVATGAREEYHECAFIVQIGVQTENSMTLNRMVTSIGDWRNHTVEAIRLHSAAMGAVLEKGFRTGSFSNNQPTYLEERDEETNYLPHEG